MISKFLWNRGCGVILNSTTAPGMSAARVPNSIEVNDANCDAKTDGATSTLSFLMAFIISACSASVAPAIRSVYAC